MHKRGSALRDARERSGYTIREMSRATGISTGHLSMIERGMAAASEDELHRMARALGVDPGDAVLRTKSGPEPERTGFVRGGELAPIVGRLY